MQHSRKQRDEDAKVVQRMHFIVNPSRLPFPVRSGRKRHVAEPDGIRARPEEVVAVCINQHRPHVEGQRAMAVYNESCPPQSATGDV